MAVDLAIFTVLDHRLSLLLVERGVAPYKGKLALPGGFVRPNEDLSEAAQRELSEETGLSATYLQQVGAFGRPNRDPRERVVSIAFFAITASGSALVAGTDATDARWVFWRDLPQLAFDHNAIVQEAHRKLVETLQDSAVALQFLPTAFTLTELQRIYEAILNEAVDKRNFRKWVQTQGFLKPTGRRTKGESYRPAALYRARAGSSLGALQHQFPFLKPIESA